MKEVIVLRHGEKDAAGNLTESGRRAAKAMRPSLSSFIYIISSPIDRAVQTAVALTAQQPESDTRAAFAATSPDISNAINALVAAHSISFLDAARLYNNPEVLDGINDQARAFNALIDELLDALPEGGKALVVSHDLTIVPAMGLRGAPAESINPLSGYAVSLNEDRLAIRRFPPSLS